MKHNYYCVKLFFQAKEIKIINDFYYYFQIRAQIHHKHVIYGYFYKLNYINKAGFFNYGIALIIIIQVLSALIHRIKNRNQLMVLLRNDCLYHHRVFLRNLRFYRYYFSFFFLFY